MKQYLGDGVYVDYDGHGFVLTTEDGICETNRIVLESEIYAALTQYAEDLTREEPHATNCLCDRCARTEGTYAYRLIHE